jgi:cytochrome c oxidase assembly protein subunit 15
VRWFSVAALIAVTAQGCLGGARVLLDERQLAMLHGCLGPAFFAVCIGLCAVTSRWWQDTKAVWRSDAVSRLHLLVLAIPLASYVQLVLGALMRHVPETASTTYFVIAVWAHLIGAGVLAATVGMVAGRTLRGKLAHPVLRWPIIVVAALVVLQIVLGCATWVVNYLWPTFVVQTTITTTYTLIEAKGLLQSLIVTGHAANGTLILGISVLLTLRVVRLLRPSQPELVRGGSVLGSATG